MLKKLILFNLPINKKYDDILNKSLILNYLLKWLLFKNISIRLYQKVKLISSKFNLKLKLIKKTYII